MLPEGAGRDDLTGWELRGDIRREDSRRSFRRKPDRCLERLGKVGIVNQRPASFVPLSCAVATVALEPGGGPV